MHYLHQNMCLEQTPEMQEFANWLLDVGAGVGLDNTNRIPIPEYMICADYTIKSLVEEIYPGIGDGEKDDQYFLDMFLPALMTM